MHHPYSHILSPLKIGQIVLKNRLIASNAVSQELQGPETFPAESTMRYCADLAKNGAAIVTCTPGMFEKQRQHSMFASSFIMDDRQVQTYFNQMIRRIHAYGSLAAASTMSLLPSDVQISKVTAPGALEKLHGPSRMPKREISRDELQEIIRDFTQYCVWLKAIGFDMIAVYMAYNGSILATSLSKYLNQRQDEYGGADLSNRARFSLELFRSIKKACGPDFLIEIQISGWDDTPNCCGYDQEEFLAYCRMCEGLVDIFQLRAADPDLAHPSSYVFQKEFPPTLKYAEAFKAAGIQGICAPVGGFQSPDLLEQILADGKADMIAMARAFICDPEYGRKLYEGRGNDIVPCIRCDKCHGAVCSVNPRVGLSHIFSDLISPAAHSHQVAIIGGGPAGMQAAITAAQRGHQVTLFERSNHLGGQLCHTDYMPEKWALKDFKDYLIRQVEQSSVVLKLNTAATPELIVKGGFDAVIAACGSSPRQLAIPGAELAMHPLDVFGHTSELGSKVIVLGGAMTAVEVALYLANTGHSVLLITRQNRIAYDNASHGLEAILRKIDESDHIKVLLEHTVEAIQPSSVICRDTSDDLHEISCDSVVFSSGSTPNVDACYAFAGLTPYYAVVGDCNLQRDNLYKIHDVHELTQLPEPAGPDVRHSIFTGYMAASRL